MAAKSKKKKSSGPTPMMQRYMEVKKENPNSILLFRMGDFYELFLEDAEIGAKILGLTLTSRDKSSDNPIPMAGFPYRALPGYLQKLIKAGLRAAICEQVEDPAKAKGMVRREVTQIVTPGTLLDDSLLDSKTSNFLACVFSKKESVGLAWLELSEGRFYCSDVALEDVANEISRLQPAECLVEEGSLLQKSLAGQGSMMTSELPAWSFAKEDCHRTLLEHLGTKTLEGFGIFDVTPAVIAAGALLGYVCETQKSALGHITQIELHQQGTHLLIDEATRRSLELTLTIRDSNREGSLLSAIDETVSPMGARLLAQWLSNPLTNLQAINYRLDAVDELVKEITLCQDLREQLAKCYDLQRLNARIATGKCSPRDLRALTDTLALLPKLKAKLAGRTSKYLDKLEQSLDLCPDIHADISATLVDEPPLLVSEGGVIRDGFLPELDELRNLARGGKEWIAKYQASEAERTGITNLKVGFNKVFGFYLEVTASQKDKVPAEYIRKQTLKNQERYITPQLKEYEEKVLQAEEKSIALETKLFKELRNRVAGECIRLKETAEVVAQTDVLAALSLLAVNQRYCRPEMTEEPLLDIREGRHPVLDRLQPTGQFVPNDVLLGTEEGRIQLITGPNMAGKSTYIRQAALLTVLAQMGSFVPASEARIGIADRIFARVGASDELSKGQSTFMVEMTETARILNSATRNSLVILDEIGRGTSTYDGVSLAWSVTEYLHDIIGCRALFATHYHELTELSQRLSHLSNWNVAVKEQAGDVIFLHKIIEGTANKSYGIHVARLAGVPQKVIDRARIILETLEGDHFNKQGESKVPSRNTHKSSQKQLTLFEQPEHPMLDKIRGIDINSMTPLDALAELNRMRNELDE